VRQTTVGQLLVNRALPPDLRDPNRVLDKKGLRDLFQKLAERHPGKYKDVAFELTKLGGEIAYSFGGLSFGPEHMRPARAALAIRSRINRELREILGAPGGNPAETERKIVEAVERHRKPLEDAVFEESMAEDNPLAHQIVSGVRGNKTNLRSLRGGDLLYADHQGRTVPIPVLRSYSEGLTPAEYWAGAFGARQGVIGVKLGTAKAGYLGKQLVQNAHRLIVTARDADSDDARAEEIGMPADADDPDSEGALLARGVGQYPRNTVLTPRILKRLRAAGHKRLLVRSPIAGGPADGGVYARDVGVREKGALPPRGDYVGVAAAQAIGEVASQAALSSKHAGGVAGAGSAGTGFRAIDAIVNPPKVFPGAAIHAQRDGRVGEVKAAPQGGTYVKVGDREHYVPPGQAVTARPGDEVEAGDALTDGLPNPNEFVKHKGIGEGRRQLVRALRSVVKNSGLRAHRRNLELLARGVVDRVEFDEEHDDWLPGDLAPYSAVAARWKPRVDAESAAPSAAIGRYLERPALHYSIGTVVRPSVARELDEFGVKSIDVHRDPPPFRPVMVRAASTLASDPDWATRHLGSGLAKGTLNAAHRGLSADTAGTSFVPAALDPLSFGRSGLTKGWDPREVEPIAGVFDDGDDDDDEA